MQSIELMTTTIANGYQGVFIENMNLAAAISDIDMHYPCRMLESLERQDDFLIVATYTGDDDSLITCRYRLPDAETADRLHSHLLM